MSTRRQRPSYITQRALLTALMCVATLSLKPSPARALVTPFGERVNQAINEGLQWLRDQQNTDGGWGRPTGLAVLCFLENRVSVDWNAPPTGYINMDPADQERVRNGIKYCVNSIEGFRGDDAESYDTGACLMAISSYLNTGGPVDVGATLPVDQAANNAVNALTTLQSRSDQNGFAYHIGGNTDMSTTQFAMAGLYAAERIIPQASSSLSLTRAYINACSAQNGGVSYRPNRDTENYAMTASGVWTRLLSGSPVEDMSVQSSLSWLNTNYTTDHNVRKNLGSTNSHYYYLWASAKAFEVSVGHQAGALYSDQIGGAVNPVDVGYPAESPRWYFDYAWFLINDQSGEGAWCQNGVPCHNEVAATSYALLVLMRSLGGVCLLDEDQDELCAQEDNCPNVPNPDQADEDGDGIGDACDNCESVPNLDQIDADNDGIGDACDPIICEPDGDDICDGRDNDCDGAIDEAASEEEGLNTSTICATGQPGICARGASACVNGEFSCVPNFSPSDDVCDGLDNDCDGLIDEGVTNACGTCGPLDPETCDGVDNDCDGDVDEDPNSALCDEFRTCYAGDCYAPCDAECADVGTVCDEESGLCLPPCTNNICDYGVSCEGTLTTSRCVDRCEGVVCTSDDDDTEDQTCWDGACVPNLCIYTGCPEGSICDGVECIPDSCAGVTCEDGQFCRRGQCVSSCAQVSCPLYQSCVDGQCVDDPCGGVTCPDNQACLSGQCVPDPCASVTCQSSQSCVNGVCIWSGCDDITCPPGQVCEANRAGAQCVRTWQVDDPVPTPPSPVMEIDMGAPPTAGTGFTPPPPDMALEPELKPAPSEGAACTQAGGRTGSPLAPLLSLVALLGLTLNPRRRATR